MTTPALLLFAHQARSYAAMIKDYADRLGVAVVVLSSKPRDVRDLEQLAALGVARLWHVDDEHLDASHVPPVLAQASAEGFTIVAALATFEGYRAGPVRVHRGVRRARRRVPPRGAGCRRRKPCQRRAREVSRRLQRHDAGNQHFPPGAGTQCRAAARRRALRR